MPIVVKLDDVLHDRRMTLTELADRVGVITAGRMVAVATPDELGGRAEQDATVAWLGPAGPRSVRTAAPTELVARLLRLAPAEFLRRGHVPVEKERALEPHRV